MDQLDRDMRDVKKAIDLEQGLTEWEIGFVESLACRVIDRRLPLTDAQREKLDEILEDNDA